MPIPRLAKRITIAFILLLGFAECVALLGWKFVQNHIATTAHAPHLVSFAEPAVDFPFRTLDGGIRHLSELRGKVVFLDLWGTWCIQCIAEMPTVQALYTHYRQDPSVVFLIVSRLDSPEAVRRYKHHNHFDLPFYTTEDADIPNSMQLNQFPATFIYALDGTLMVKHTGAADWSSPSVVSFIDGLKKNPRHAAFQ